MANTIYIREVTLAQISDSTNTVNAIGTAPVANVKQARASAYEPIVVRVTDHVADDGGTTDFSEGMALFCSVRHGEPWVMIGHQSQKITHPLPGAVPAPIASGTDYSVIYPDFDYTTFS